MNFKIYSDGSFFRWVFKQTVKKKKFFWKKYNFDIITKF